MKNIFLVGMPGCGKSTVGAVLAQKLNMSFYDTDHLLETDAKMTIPEIFKECGETFFRERERETIKKVCTEFTNSVIATGGGAVLKGENVERMKNSGKIIFIDTDFDILVSRELDGRPLLAGEDRKQAMKVLWEKRLPVYTGCADYIVKNDFSPEETVSKIVKELGYE